MYPAHMSSYPHHKNQTPPHFYNPTWETFPPRMEENQANSPQMHQHWPHNYAYPTPMPCQDCCSHGQHHAYYNYRPPCPHFPSPPPYGYGHFHGGYPAAYPSPYPYVPPPPHYSMASPNGFHCYECPNHQSHVNITNNVKIEEHEPDGEMSKAEALVPARVNNSPASPHPLLWAPPEYMMNKEQPKLVGESGIGEKHVTPYDENRKPKQGSQAVEQGPNAGYQWFPLDMDSIKQLMEGGKVVKPHDQEKKSGDEKQALGVEEKDLNKQFSYPIIRMPYDRLIDHFGGKAPAEGQEERKSDAVQTVEKHPSAFKAMKHPDEEIVKERAVERDRANGGGTQGSRKTGIVRVIPVKQLDDSASKSLKHEQESEVNGSASRGSVKNETGVKPSSTTKKSKLPPICLRVDPPKKKNGKGGSRLLSPPREKKQHDDSTGERKDKELRVDREEIHVTGVTEKDSNGNDDVKEGQGVCTQEYRPEAEVKVLHVVEPLGVDGNEDSDNGAPPRKLLSETEAAIVIQSAYRGYAVRRWEPLKKLRQIANVKEEASNVKGQIEKLESCVTIDNKEKVVVGETIMNMLLKLDSIQGLHPSVREIRRLVTKELVTLQEKLDCIVSQHSSTTEGVGEQSTALSSVEDSAGSVETGTKTSEIAEQCGAFNAYQNVEPLKDVFISTNGKVVVDNEEPGRDPRNEEDEAMLPVGNPELCRGRKDKELDELITPENFSMESQKTLADAEPFKNTSLQFDIGSSDKDQEANMLANSLQETVEQQVDIDKDREVDQPNVKPGDLSGAVTIEHEHDMLAETIPISEQGDQLHNPMAEEMLSVKPLIEVEDDVAKETADEGLPEEATEEKCDGDVASALEIEKMEEKHAQEESYGEIIEENEVDSSEVQHADQPQVERGHLLGIEQENGVESSEVKHTDQPQIEHEQLIAIEQENKVESSEVQHADQPQIQREHLIAIGQEHRTIVESCEEDAIFTRESETTDDPKGMEIPVIEVEKEVIKEDQEIAGDGRREETTIASHSGLQTVSDSHITEGVTEEGNTEPPTCMTDAQQCKDGRETSYVSSTGEQIERRIIEENEKLRNMVEQLLISGREQQEVISSLAAKVIDLEKKMPKRSKIRSVRRPGIAVSRGKSLVPH